MPAPVAEVDEQLKGFVEHFLRPLIVAPKAIRDAGVEERGRLPEPMTQVGE